MLYELIGIVRPGNLAEIKEIVMTSGQLVLRGGGVVRSIANWGVFALPRPISKHQVQHTRGHYFVMRFDSSVAAQQSIRSTLALDPRVVRSSVVRLGDNKLENTSKIGEIHWGQPIDRK